MTMPFNYEQAKRCARWLKSNRSDLYDIRVVESLDTVAAWITYHRRDDPDDVNGFDAERTVRNMTEYADLVARIT